MDILKTVLEYDNHVRPKGVDFSVSELSGNSNYQLWQRKQGTPKTYKLPLENMISSKVGTGFHMLAEEAIKAKKFGDIDYFIEKLMSTEIADKIISGTPDIIYKKEDSWVVGDYKTKGTFQMKKALKEGLPETEIQMSIYAYMFSTIYGKPMPISGEIYLVHMGDRGWWSKADCALLGIPEKSTVPKYHTLVVPLMNAEEVEAYVAKRIKDSNREPAMDCCIEWNRCGYCDYDCEMRV